MIKGEYIDKRQGQLMQEAVARRRQQRNRAVITQHEVSVPQRPNLDQSSHHKCSLDRASCNTGHTGIEGLADYPSVWRHKDGACLWYAPTWQRRHEIVAHDHNHSNAVLFLKDHASEMHWFPCKQNESEDNRSNNSIHNKSQGISIDIDPTLCYPL